MTRSKLWMLAGASLLAVAPAIAFEGGASDDEVVKALELETARSNALKARYEAEQAAATARFAPLQALAGQGNVERGEGAGQMEAAYLAATATRRAAELIDDTVENRTAPGTEVTLLVGEEAFSLDALAAFRAETSGIGAAFHTALQPAASCVDPAEERTGAQLTQAIGPAGLIPIIGAVAGLLRSDITIQGVGDLASNRMLALAVAGERPGIYVRPALLLSPRVLAGNEVNTTLRHLYACRRAAVLATPAPARSQAGPAKARREALEAAIARFDTYLAAITTSGETGAVRLATILKQSLLAQGSRPVLQVYVERGGGSLITRKNIGTALGLPAVTASGGVVVSYALAEPATGETIASGFFVCNSGMHDIRRVQRLADISAECSPSAAAQRIGPARAAVRPASAAVGSTARAPIAPRRSPDGEVRFRSVHDLNQDVGASQPMLRGAMMIANSRDWQASLYTTFETARGTASCTAALVGPQAVLTAAHCVPGSRRIQIDFANRRYGAVCDVHSQYADQSDDSADYALCRIDQRVAVPPGVQFETINTGSINGMLGQRLVLGGYGCTSDLVRENEVDGQYRIGFNNVEETSNSPARRYGDDLYSGREDNNLFTSDDPELANVCPGDSGGPAFEARAGDDGLYGRRSIVGVNSRVFYRDFNDDGTPRSYGASLISATGGPDFRSWALAWAARVRVPVCGLVSGVPNCRN